MLLTIIVCPKRGFETQINWWKDFWRKISKCWSFTQGTKKESNPTNSSELSTLNEQKAVLINFATWSTAWTTKLKLRQWNEKKIRLQRLIYSTLSTSYGLY